MRSDSLLQHIETIETIASRVQSFVRDMDEASFLSDTRTQMAVMLCLVLIGEAVIKIDGEAPEFLAQHPHVPWARSEICETSFCLTMSRSSCLPSGGRSLKSSPICKRVLPPSETGARKVNKH